MLLLSSFQLTSPMTSIQILHYAASFTSESTAALRSAAMISVEKAFQDDLLYNFSDHHKQILVCLNTLFFFASIRSAAVHELVS